ncbi:MAG: hypothetical protein VB067_03645, partial [Christensenellaceae bacterium]|nr:hypothetical protein [Christensenellaceae bacterium]
VVVGSGAKVLGPFAVGDGVKIGASAVVLKAVPPGATVVGNPGRIVKKAGERAPIDLDQVNLPDPVKEVIQKLLSRVERLEHCLAQGNVNCDACDEKAMPDCPRIRKEDMHIEDL